MAASKKELNLAMTTMNMGTQGKQTGAEEDKRTAPEIRRDRCREYREQQKPDVVFTQEISAPKQWTESIKGTEYKAFHSGSEAGLVIKEDLNPKHVDAGEKDKINHTFEDRSRMCAAVIEKDGELVLVNSCHAPHKASHSQKAEYIQQASDFTQALAKEQGVSSVVLAGDFNHKAKAVKGRVDGFTVAASDDSSIDYFLTSNNISSTQPSTGTYGEINIKGEKGYLDHNPVDTTITLPPGSTSSAVDGLTQTMSGLSIAPSGGQ